MRVAGGRLKACGKPDGYEILYSLGTSENGGNVIFKSIRISMDSDIPIGKPWNNNRVYLDPETGEMAVSGPSLFRGYLSDKEGTRRKLIKNPYSDEPGYEMVYLTGDLARLDENGELLHMGRNDWTVKIRDMRVNPVQVETALGGCEGVTDCCVTVQTLGGENILAAWITGNADIGTVKIDLAARLPEFMIPSVFVTLDSLPRNVNGKIDRNKLLYTPPEQSIPDTAAVASPSAVISTLFMRVLGCAAGQDDSFLALGGDSLKLMRLQAEIEREFSVNIPYTTLTKNPNPRKIAKMLGSLPGFAQIPAAPVMDTYPLPRPLPCPAISRARQY